MPIRPCAARAAWLFASGSSLRQGVHGILITFNVSFHLQLGVCAKHRSLGSHVADGPKGQRNFSAEVRLAHVDAVSRSYHPPCNREGLQAALSEEFGSQLSGARQHARCPQPGHGRSGHGGPRGMGLPRTRA
eukprot:scaffold128969_cov54-Phaeocystis_antarctica.AAC.6